MVSNAEMSAASFSSRRGANVGNDPVPVRLLLARPMCFEGARLSCHRPALTLNLKDEKMLRMEKRPVSDYDLSAPWNLDIEGEQLLPLINEDASVIRVQAGPGTGKTHGLRRRILRLMHPKGLGIVPSKVLVCAFNRVIAKDLEKEIRKELAQHKLGMPVVRTIHSLCSEMLNQPSRILLPNEIEVMIYDVRVEDPTMNEQFGNKQATALRALREHEAGFASHASLAAAVRRWLADHNASLMGDVTRKMEVALRNGVVPDQVYDHVIVDEFQDLTESETSVVVKLRSPSSSLVAVGDRKQSIYAFRGNAEKGLSALPEMVNEPIFDFPMDECRRCPAEIVKLANSVMESEGEPLVPVRGAGGQVHQVHFGSLEQECKGMAKEIVRVYLATRKDPRECREEDQDRHLVLVTRRRWGYELRNSIREFNPTVPVQTVFAEDALETWPAREAFAFFSIIADPSDAVALRDWIGYQKPQDGKKFLAKERNAEVYHAIRQEMGVLTVELAENLATVSSSTLRGSGKTNVLHRLTRLRDLRGGLPSAEDARTIVDYIFDPQKWAAEDWDDAALAREDIQRLHCEATRLLAEMNEPSLPKLVRALRFRIATREPLSEEASSGIRVVTLWGAKGLNAHYVYILGLCDEALPGRHKPDSTGLEPGEHLDEQRRLLYVSLTRAKKALVLSRPTTIKRGSVAALGLTRTNHGNSFRQTLWPTRFIDELPSGVLPDSVSSEQWAGIKIQ